MSKRKGQTARRSEPLGARASSPAASTGSPSPRAAWLTRAAFGIAIAVVIARLLMTESIRSVTDIYPGSPNVPAGPGPSSGLLLDLMAGLCPILVLLRRSIDVTFPLRFAWAALVFVVLGAWSLISVAWAADRFAAVVSACHLMSAAGLLWAMAQVCRKPAHTRVVAGLCAGLLGVLLVHGLWYEFVDRAELKKQWETNRQQMLAARNVQPGTFDYIQLENKIFRGELMGFSASPNTYAALLVMLGIVTLGSAAQLVRSERWIGAAVMLILLVATAAVLPLTQSRTGYLTAILGIVVLATAVALRDLLRRRSAVMYVAGVIVVLGGIAFVVGYGASRGELFHDSLNFRWRYWVGSFELWAQHPLLGVGWENFGPNYLGVRVPEATEEIKDPHNYLVRFATELGIVGAILALAWTAMTLWTITRPAELPNAVMDSTSTDPADDQADAAEARTLLPVGRIAGVAVAIAFGFLLNYLCAFDHTQEGGYLLFEGFRSAAYLLALLLIGGALWLTLVRQGREPMLAFDAGPAPLINLALVVAIGMFFIHNLIDFAMFEFGPMFLIALLVGTAMGASIHASAENAANAPDAEHAGRVAGATRDARPSDDRRSPGRRAARAGLAVAGAAWCIGAIAVVIPIVSSEAVAADADASLRRNVPAVAAKGYESAFQNTVRNGDYAFRAATAWRWAGDPPRTKAMLDLAIEANPLDAGYRVSRAELARSLRPPADQMAADDYAAAIKLDPNNLQNRIRYADVLEKLTLPREAAEQLEKVLELNGRLKEEEKKRLPKAQETDIASRVEKLRGRR